ncbi:hypothetical protein Micbo1qcDRAFT_169706 [Microdochium bolleyi]|uniref:glutathione transferase n=1 Tax=Microdochium bolleyi TaxID=196109 RepID=A0A136IJT8_9PEZI|nr:hypothetical protein Micbo1qcDRAFT_169706 [Microdochium bolleyi]
MDNNAPVALGRPEFDKDKVVVYCLGFVDGRLPLNQLKTLVACEALGISYHAYEVNKERDDVWLRTINPYTLMPSVEDTKTYVTSDGETRRIPLFDSTAIMVYLGENYDPEGLFRGRDAAERASVLCWLVSYASGLCSTGELWLKLLNPQGVHTATLERLVGLIHKEYDVLERRLSEPGQRFIGLADRPSIADLAIHPSANGFVTGLAGIDFTKWPRLKAWSETMSEFPYSRKATFFNNTNFCSEEYVASLTPEAKEAMSHIQGPSYKLKSKN